MTQTHNLTEVWTQLKKRSIKQLRFSNAKIDEIWIQTEFSRLSFKYFFAKVPEYDINEQSTKNQVLYKTPSVPKNGVILFLYYYLEFFFILYYFYIKVSKVFGPKSVIGHEPDKFESRKSDYLNHRFPTGNGKVEMEENIRKLWYYRNFFKCSNEKWTKRISKKQIWKENLWKIQFSRTYVMVLSKVWCYQKYEKL